MGYPQSFVKLFLLLEYEELSYPGNRKRSGLPCGNGDVAVGTGALEASCTGCDEVDEAELPQGEMLK